MVSAFPLSCLFSKRASYFCPGALLRRNSVAASEQAREVGVADFLTRGAQAFTGSFFRTLDETPIGGEVLHPWKAGNIMDFVEQPEAEDFSNTGHRLQEVESLGIVLRGGFKAVELQVTEELIILGDQGQVDLDVLLDRQIANAVSDPRTIGLVGDFLPDVGQIVPRVGILHMR
jgi:hypothetical protein